MTKIFTCLFILFISASVKSQSLSSDNGNFTLSGYAEIYYGFDFNRPPNNTRPDFIFSHSRVNEVSLNLGFIKAHYDNGMVRSNLAIMTGTYANSNLAAEPGVIRNIFEANAGLKLSKTANLWLDAGIFSSHIGFESAVSKNDWVLTRNLSSESTPYYEAGAKISYTTPNGKLLLSALYLNGWQRIYRETDNTKPAGGLQINYKLFDNVTLNYSNYLGTEGADSVNTIRLWNDFYGIFQITQQFGITAGFDFGSQQLTKGGSSYIHAYSPVVIAQYKFDPKWAVAGRVEYFNDKNGMLVPIHTANGFQTAGYSANIDFKPVPNAVLRLEGKIYDSKDRIFTRFGQPISTNPLLTASLAVSF